MSDDASRHARLLRMLAIACVSGLLLIVCARVVGQPEQQELSPGPSGTISGEDFRVLF